MTVVKELDFEETQIYYVNIQASDKAVAPERRRTALTVLTVHVTDSDDQVSRHRAVVIHQIKNTDNNIGLVGVETFGDFSRLGVDRDKPRNSSFGLRFIALGLPL